MGTPRPILLPVRGSPVPQCRGLGAVSRPPRGPCCICHFCLARPWGLVSTGRDEPRHQPGAALVLERGQSLSPSCHPAAVSFGPSVNAEALRPPAASLRGQAGRSLGSSALRWEDGAWLLQGHLVTGRRCCSRESVRLQFSPVWAPLEESLTSLGSQPRAARSGRGLPRGPQEHRSRSGRTVTSHWPVTSVEFSVSQPTFFLLTNPLKEPAP